MSKNLPRIFAVLAAVLFILLLAGCEPNDWYRILAAPPPVENPSWSGHGVNNITFDFTLPDLSEELAFFPNYFFQVYLYSRPDPGSQETYHTSWYFDSSDAGNPQSEPVTLSGLTGGLGYVFILYTVDTEFQKSTPVETAPVTW